MKNLRLPLLGLLSSVLWLAGCVNTAGPKLPAPIPVGLERAK